MGSIISNFFKGVFSSLSYALGALLGILFIALVLIGVFRGVIGGSFAVDNNNIIGTTHKVEMSPEMGSQGLFPELDETTPWILKLDLKGIIGAERLTGEHFSRQLAIIFDAAEKEHLQKQIDQKKLLPVTTLQAEAKELHDSENKTTIRRPTRIAGILLMCNTPGGGVLEIDVIYRALVEYKERYQIPIFAYVEGMCASGGVYITAVADRIAASPCSLIGSIGVRIDHLNLSQLMDKVGVSSTTLTRGKGKDSMNPLRPWGPGEDADEQLIMDFFYNRFLDIITTHRPGLSRANLIDELGAKLLPAAEAAKFGLIEEVCFSYQKALVSAESLFFPGVEHPQYHVVSPLIRHTLLDEFSHTFQGISQQVLLQKILPQTQISTINY